MDITIKPYRKRFEKELMDMILLEGDDWKDYTALEKRDLYILSLEKSITYLLFEDKVLAGYVRAIEDYGYQIYICDLLVTPKHRGKGYGNQLMRHIQKKYPKLDCYVMSDVDDYYIKQGYFKEGSIFLLPKL
jgi:ribosomal protein S18 acetylase RimI-like enzyme